MKDQGFCKLSHSSEMQNNTLMHRESLKVLLQLRNESYNFVIF